MAKKKSSKSSGKLFLVLFIIAFVLVLHLLRQLEIKEKELTGFKNKETQKQSTKQNINLMEEKQQLNVRIQIKENLEKIVGRKPKMADGWFISDIKFIEADKVKISYEDGHEAGEMLITVIDPLNYQTWIKAEKQ